MAGFGSSRDDLSNWIPACAGMTSYLSSGSAGGNGLPFGSYAGGV